MKTDKKPIIGFICVMLSCILVIGITIGLLSSANNKVAAGTTTDTTADTTDESTPDIPEEPIVDEPELQWGYKFKYFDGCIDGGWVGDIAYKSQKNTFNIDDVTLTVSFGSFLSGYGPVDCDVPEFDIYFADPSGYLDVSIYDLKTVEDQFFSEKYDIDFVDDRPNGVYYYEYAYSEEITIPKELFTENEGIIRLVIAGMNIAEHSDYVNDYLILGQADIKYQLQGDEVILSKPCDDEWHY